MGRDDVERTADGRFVVVDGRRWRATDPALPEDLRQHLVDALMDARRAVGAGKRADDADAVAAARRRVQDAKVALGERGQPWWEPAEAEALAARRAAAERALAGRVDDPAAATRRALAHRSR